MVDCEIVCLVDWVTLFVVVVLFFFFKFFFVVKFCWFCDVVIFNDNGLL